jgi:hypothetical protein
MMMMMINEPDASNGRLHVTLRQYARDPLRKLALVSLYIKTCPRNLPRFCRYPQKSFHITSHTLPHSLSSTLLSLVKVSGVHCSGSHRSHKEVWQKHEVISYLRKPYTPSYCLNINIKILGLNSTRMKVIYSSGAKNATLEILAA